MEIMYDSVRKLLVLDAIRRLGNQVAIPLTANWKILEGDLQVLVEEELLSNDSVHYFIGDRGKKTLLLFDSERKEVCEPLEVYKEVVIDGETIDGRMPIASFTLRSSPIKMAINALHSIHFSIFWDKYIDQIVEMDKDGVCWQELIKSNRFISESLNDLDLMGWAKLGKTRLEAANTAAWMLNPAQDNTGLIQLNG